MQDNKYSFPIPIAVSGGIGSGKSVVSRILRIMGYAVYDCDSRAKQIMDADSELIDNIAAMIDEGAVAILDNGDKIILRKKLAETVFNDASKLSILNSLVHDAVKRDISDWCVSMHADREYNRPYIFVETAILTQSGLDRMVSGVWEVSAPDEIRIQRAMNRDGATREEIEKRIARQQESECAPACNPANVHVILNDGITPLLPQINALLA